jgi:chromosome transmission fidelity protein 4
VDVMDSSQQKTFRGHDAPVLSLSFDPKDIFLVIIFSSLFMFFLKIFKILRELADNFTPLVKGYLIESIEPISM